MVNLPLGPPLRVYPNHVRGAPLVVTSAADWPLFAWPHAAEWKPPLKVCAADLPPMAVAAFTRRALPCNGGREVTSSVRPLEMPPAETWGRHIY
jgi:hypothetical protein